MFKYTVTVKLCSFEVRKTRKRCTSYCNIASSSCNKMCAVEINLNVIRGHKNFKMLITQIKYPNLFFR
jgi:hypothetical protein